MITQEQLKKFLHYNPDTGVFTRLVCVNQFKVGEPAGDVDGGGYLRTSIKGIRYKCHRLAWFYVYGYWPSKIDHINHIKTDNRIINLREVSHQENMKNASLQKNSIGFNGVDKHKASGKWRARIALDGKEIHLGLFDDLNKAIKCRKEANIKYGYHENHGR